MKHDPVTRVLLILLSLGGPIAAAAQSAQPDPALHALPLRLAAPQWPPLTAQQIRGLVADRMVIVEDGYEPAPGIKLRAFFVGGCPPAETFFPDGRWEMGVCERAYRVFKGFWSTEAFRGGDRLCVEANDRPKACRFVWQGAVADQIVMSQPSRAGADTSNEDYSPYRISPRRE